MSVRGEVGSQISRTVHLLEFWGSVTDLRFVNPRDAILRNFARY